ncbi:DPB3 [Candida oxycetoniae]|uniref:DPB3 n=1 Tax=Candida oxycetoniae TaxID=497107 RepID=A0AAI9SVK5_9ASCO|nr:DPB3 [Candida oxycetoniae]KAI3403873.2 DPB3 [Candida oxycetoniae]
MAVRKIDVETETTEGEQDVNTLPESRQMQSPVVSPATDDTEFQDIPMEDVQENQDPTSSSSDQMSLPLSKIKKIFKMDAEYTGASQGAVYTAGIATELFVQYLVEQASLLAKMDKRKKIQYKDFANAVSSHDALNFLSDTVPRTHPIGELVKKKQVNLIEKPSASRKVGDNVTVANTTAITTNTTTATNSFSSSSSSSTNALKNDPVLPKGQQILNFQPQVEAKVTKRTNGINDLASLLEKEEEKDEVEKEKEVLDKNSDTLN